MTRTIPSAVAIPPEAPRGLDLAALVGPAGWQRLPAAVRRRFGVGHGAATYVGRMTLRCSPVGRVFAALARVFGSPLSGVTDDAVPMLPATSVAISVSVCCPFATVVDGHAYE